MEALLNNFYDRTRAECRVECRVEGITEVVINMINENVPDEIIAKYTKFPLSQIEKIRKEQSQ